MISLRNVVKKFGGQTVLEGITLDVRKGETMVIMGGSGSGKSTTLRLMIGSFPADGGEIRLFGQNICGLREAKMNEVRKKFGILFQSGALFNSMTIYDNVALPIREHTDLDRDIIDIQVQIKLELVGLREAAQKYPSQISGGMKKRAGLARALALDPQILFYDEPSAGLDPVTSAQIDTLIVDLSKKLGVTSVVVTHEMDSAFTIADRMAMLDKGRMLTVQTRQWYDDLRRMGEQEAAALDEDRRLIRQFLRGDAAGPITDRQAARSDFAAALFGDDFGPIAPRDTPSIQPSR
ncbi:MAG: ABC transporter ATP-binding protein [Phycisphaeraceae bacterium]|nr:ABC transporter ATP-binding protein [Phycisphaeraceae bacterium]